MGNHNRNPLLLLLLSLASLTLGQGSDSDEDTPEAGQKEIFSSWALLILITLLVAAFFTSYILQAKRIQAVHETVISIFAGMVVGLILRLIGVESVLSSVSFDYQFFFNLLLPPIILAAGYELHQVCYMHSPPVGCAKAVSGQLLPQYGHHSHLRLCRYLYLRPCPWRYTLAMDPHSARGTRH